MKFTINEISFLKNSIESVNIKSIDAPTVAKVIEKVSKEFDRLQSMEMSNTKEQSLNISK